MISVLFYLAAAVAVVSSLLVISRRNAVHALLYLINSLLAVALLFFLLGAPFVAALEVIVYAGAIMVLFIFVVMMFNLEESAKKKSAWFRFRAWIGPAVMSLILLAELAIVLASSGTGAMKPPWISPRAVGVSLFSTYALGVELASMLLLAAAVGAFHLGRRTGTGSPGEGANG